MMKSICLLCLSAVLILLNACGFHLQSKPELPPQMQRTRLEVQSPYSQFARRLETHLEQAGVNVVTALDGAAILEVPVNATRKEIQSIGDNARVREFRVRHTVQFRLLASDGTEMIPLQTFEQSRVYSFNEQDILAAEREDEFLRNDLADNLARMVVRRLGTYGK
ncbi:MAG: LPS assembly lipoprotein LptE [Xanthomonadales bacterium]|nr:LPS assembly lipoprotein LptE [Xanthomonadales bacterium]